MSITIVALVIILLFVFRKIVKSTVKSINDELPQTVTITMTELRQVIATNALETRVELQERTQEAINKLQAMGDIQSAEDILKQLNSGTFNKPNNP